MRSRWWLRAWLSRMASRSQISDFPTRMAMSWAHWRSRSEDDPAATSDLARVFMDRKASRRSSLVTSPSSRTSWMNPTGSRVPLAIRMVREATVPIWRTSRFGIPSLGASHRRHAFSTARGERTSWVARLVTRVPSFGGFALGYLLVSMNLSRVFDKTLGSPMMTTSGLA
jgi:hypothetical protein